MTLVDQASALRTLAAGTRPRATVVAITSGKGGVGKSNIAVNLAAHLARVDKRVVLFDADLGLANADVLCNIELPCNLSHVVANKRTLAEALVPTPAGFRLVGGASGLARMADLSDRDRQRLVGALELLEYQADVILIDTGAGISPNVLCFTRAADEVLVVTTPEPTAITDAYAVIKVLSRGQREAADGESPRLNLLVNQCRSAEEARLVYERISRVAHQFLGVAVFDAGFVLHDPAVPDAVRARRPFLLASPRCPAARCIAQLAVRLHDGLVPTVHTGGFFNRMSRWFWR
jgi:flagellar biosynthesis protein FlhG